MAPMSFACLTLALIALGEGNGEFLKVARKLSIDHVSEKDIQTSLLAEVEDTLGIGSASNRLRLLEAILKPMYTALPKNEYGKLGHSTVRYALHRLFIMRHGWHIKGLGRDTDSWDAASPAGVLTDHVPSYIQNLFEKRLGEKGLGLHELAVMAATMEHLIHKEVVSKLGDVYNLTEALPTQSVSEAQADELLDIYMMAFILGENLQNLSYADARALVNEMPDLFVGWKGTQEFIRGIRKNITNDPQMNTSPQLDFNTLAKVLDVVGEEFGTFQQTDCNELKTTMMNMEFRNTGRVKLGDFYKPGLDGNWQFQESVGYLRQVGALDESSPNDTSVVIVNYLHSFANCIAPSGFFSVCCKDECQSLFGHLEEKIGAAEATPDTITAIVAKLPSSTMTSPRQLSSSLLMRLTGIAAEHGGMVPLHGRLFAQWMHNAYPRECPYPHLSGTTNQQTPDEFTLDSGMEASATDEEMKQFAPTSNITSYATEDNVEESLPWSFEEELLVVRPKQQTTGGDNPYAKLRPVALWAVAGCLAFSLMRNFKTASASNDIAYTKFAV